MCVHKVIKWGWGKGAILNIKTSFASISWPYKGIKRLNHQPYSPGLALANLFPKVKNALAGMHIEHDDDKKDCAGVSNPIVAQGQE